MNGATATREVAAERQAIAALAGELGRRELAPQALALDERRPEALEAAWERVAEVGFDRALLAVEDGGVGLDAGSLLLCLEEIAVGDGGIALLVLLANAALATLPPELAARVGERERWALVPAPPQRLATSARVSVTAAAGGGTALTGALSPALGALGADGIVVAEAGAEPTLLALAADAPGLELEEAPPLLGLRAAGAAHVSLSGAVAETISPPAGAGATPALLHAGAAAIARGIARRARELALEYAETRAQGGVAIVEHDAVRGMLAAMTVREAATPAPSAADVDEAHALHVKVAATEAAVATTTDAVQVFGGTGYMHDTGVEKLMRDAKTLSLWPEPNWIADDPIVDAALGA